MKQMKWCIGFILVAFLFTPGLAFSSETEIPKWVQNMKWKGDLRLRYQRQEKEGSPDRHRGRIRFRLGVETKVTDEVKVVARLATGSTDPRSTNQTLQNTFETKNIMLDRAYAQYTPTDWAKLVGGKVKIPLYTPSDLLWDSDLAFEGAAANFNWKVIPAVKLFLNAGWFVLDEFKKSSHDPSMYSFQPGIDLKISDNVGWKLSGSYYGFEHVQWTSLEHSAGTNTTTAAGNLLYEYDSYGVSGEFALSDLFGEVIPRIALIGEYITNSDPDEDNEGYLAGVKIGTKKVKKPWQWQLYYNYRRLEKDAFLDVFPDSDFYGGNTGVKGYEVVLQCALLKNVIMGFDYYITEPIEEDDGEEERLFQADLVLKF